MPDFTHRLSTEELMDDPSGSMLDIAVPIRDGHFGDLAGDIDQSHRFNQAKGTGTVHRTVVA